MYNKALEAAMNQQIKEEFASAYVYLSMAAYCEAQNYPGFAHWLGMQAQEEAGHAIRFYAFVNDRGGRVTLQAIPQPPSEFESIEKLFEEVLKHEQSITGMIHSLYGLAMQEKDWASVPFLQSFVAEQIEEEKSATNVLAMVRMAAGNPQSLLLLDRELAKRE
ncbi:MAG TPA: ferritin [Symbiobacteriaceae bacterium]|nr:ferritin [Symbiobacteriaceae bacterium]